MQLSAWFLLVVIIAVGVCSALPSNFQEKEKQDHQQGHELLRRARRSPVPEEGRNRAKIGIYEDSRKGPVVKAEGSGTVWQSRDKRIEAKVGVDYTQPLRHGHGEGSAFFKVQGTF
ncbi:hypothetical protein L798_12334 [Zootermopsis nevadensis]|uniref:Attacin C-terminal domain-containing protein n=1 Tax=Zootermopsis nevadensis TaxID=136037 RepID=A0A067QUQ8_ZOONE|nr:hypothetical protein L798_12334 [Zootermopsis nevadensis]